MRSYNIAAYISGSGSNLKSVIESSLKGKIASKIRLVIANKNADGLKYPSSLGIETAVIERKKLPRKEFVDLQFRLLEKHGIDLIILAGYLKKIPDEIIEKFRGRIINIHPALLPKFGGKGMHGIQVHKAVIEAGEKSSGPTVHFVDEKYDHGDIILQEKIAVAEGETPESLQRKVLKIEHRIYTEALKLLEEMK